MTEPSEPFLIVEDDDQIARGLARDLKRHGDVRVAGTMHEADRAIADTRWSGLVVDVGLPDGSGLDLLERLRVAGDTTPTLVLTGFPHRDVIERAQRLNAHYAAKPLSPAGLEAFARWALQQASVRRRQDQEVEQLRLAVEELPAMVFDAREDERRCLARDIHDGAGQGLTSVLLGLKRLHDELDDPRLRAQVDSLVEQTRTTLDELGRLTRAMHPALLEELGLAAAARCVAREFAAVHDLRLKLDVTLGDVPAAHSGLVIPNRTALVLYRALQEALTNVARHAQASTVRVSLARCDGKLRLEVEDNGRGCDPRRHASLGLGLHGMRERVAIVGGEVSLASTVGRTLLIVEVPSGEGEGAQDQGPIGR
jgi:signal transduction histidine kinase